MSNGEAAKDIQSFVRRQLAAAGWKVLNDNGAETSFQHGDHVIVITNQGHGSINWVGYIEVPRDDSDHDDMLGCTGEAPIPCVSLELDGTVGQCRVIRHFGDGEPPQLRSEEFLVGNIQSVFADALMHTTREIEREKRRCEAQ